MASWITTFYSGNQPEILEVTEDLTANELIAEIVGLNSMRVTFDNREYTNEAHYYRGRLRLVTGCVSSIRELDSLWKLEFDKLIICGNVPQGTYLPNICRNAKHIFGRTNILGLCPDRSKIKELPFPKRWKQHQYLPNCTYRTKYIEDLPEYAKHHDIRNIKSARSYGPADIKKFNRLIVKCAWLDNMQGVEAYHMTLEKAKIDYIFEAEEVIARIRDFLINIKVHRLDMTIDKPDMDLSGLVDIDIPECHLRAYEIWANGRKVCIKSLNQTIKMQMPKRFQTTKSARN